MNCIHELAPWCSSCNGTEDRFGAAHVPLDYAGHHFDLLDPEVAKAVLGGVTAFKPAPPANNPAPSERDYDEALLRSWMRAYDEMYDCSYCTEAVRDGMDEDTVCVAHVVGDHDESHSLPTTQYLPTVGRPAWMKAAGILS